MAGGPRIPLETRFGGKVYRRGPDECWPWRGSVHHSGYGTISSGGLGAKTLLAHRVAYELANGPIPDGPGYHGFCVCHACDNKLCCNPSHLWLGTNKENTADRDKKGRQVALFGEAHGMSKLTTTAVAEIRQAFGTQREIAARYGISQWYVSAIRRGKHRTKDHLAHQEKPNELA